MIKDLTGQKFGRLIVIKFSYKKCTNSYWDCLCGCGNKKIIKGSSLKNNTTKSCGCLQKEIASKMNFKHGLTGTRIYFVWWSAKERCNNPKCKAYPDYGGRGILFCNRWINSFENFYEDMEEEYEEHVSKYGEKNTFIERKNNNLGYSKENCCFKTRIEQNNNKRNNHFLTYNGKTQTISQWAKELNISRGTISSRLRRTKWSIKKILTFKPVIGRNQYVKNYN